VKNDRKRINKYVGEREGRRGKEINVVEEEHMNEDKDTLITSV
jgi:hypothetical protein